MQTVQLYPDEFVTLLAIDMIKAKGWPVMPSGLFYEHGFLFSYLGSLVSLIDSSPLAVRWLSLWLGLATVGLTFWVGQRWYSVSAGLIAAAGLAIAPAAIHWSGRVRMYALLQLLVLLTIYLTYEGLSRQQARLRWAALLTYLGATLAHFVAVALAPPLVLALIAIVWAKKRTNSTSATNGASPSANLNRRRSYLLEILAFVAILVIAFLVKRAGQPKGLEALDANAAGAATGLVQVLNVYSDFSFNALAGWQAISPFYLNLPALIFAPLAGLAVVVCLVQLFKIKAKAEAKRSNLQFEIFNAQLVTLFLGLILLTTTLEMILFVSADRRDDKYLFMLLPILFLLGAYGLVIVSHWLLVIISRRNPNRQIDHPNRRSPLTTSQLIVSLIVMGLIAVITWPAIQSLLANTGDNYDAAFAYVRANWQDGDTVLTGTPAAAALYLGRNDFYGVQRRGGYDYRLLTIGGQAVDRWLASPAIRTEVDLHQTLAANKVWLVLERWGLQREYYDLPFQQQLLAQTDLITQSQGIFVLRSKTNPQSIAMQPAHSVQATFGDVVQLLGYTAEPEQPEPGQSLRLTLYWQPIAAMAHNYTVFVHLRQPTGGNVAQADHRPLGDLYPTSIWPVGETIRETSELNLPADIPPGDYDLWVGVYLLETGERLPVQNDTSGENAVLIGRLRVE
ncbi:MAG: glycosyltransferase family 39 protein [Anaerolineae bacterium]|nr:glycosyltransferase family 39 protein [Anaerolineae bacterium]